MTHSATAARTGSRGRWTALNIVLMILGFVVFWPLGLAMLAWIIWGDEIAAKFEALQGSFRGPRHAQSGPFGRASDAAFDEYRVRELELLEEERRKLQAMRREMEAFMEEFRRVRDQEEFGRFMSTFRGRSDGTGEAG